MNDTKHEEHTMTEEGHEATEVVEQSKETTEEESDFFIAWKEKYQAHLSQQQVENHPPILEETEQDSSDAPLDKKETRKRHLAFFQRKKTDTQPRTPIPSGALWRAASIYFVFLFLLFFSIYLISPFGKQKYFTVSGNNRVSDTLVKKYSLIRPQDYVVTIALNKDAYATNIERNSKLIKDAHIQFDIPNRFSIQIEEYKELGFVTEEEQFFSVLSSGEVSEIPADKATLGERYTSINLIDRELIRKLALQLDKVDEGILTNIQSIDLTPSKSTADLLTLTMYDGNKVVVPLSEIEYKLVYYSKIAPQLMVASTIDMEVGIFSYAN